MPFFLIFFLRFLSLSLLRLLSDYFLHFHYFLSLFSPSCLRAWCAPCFERDATRFTLMFTPMLMPLYYYADAMLPRARCLMLPMICRDAFAYAARAMLLFTLLRCLLMPLSLFRFLLLLSFIFFSLRFFIFITIFAFIFRSLSFLHYITRIFRYGINIYIFTIISFHCIVIYTISLIHDWLSPSNRIAISHYWYDISLLAGRDCIID